MPKETFFNLPEEKRQLICDVAIEEFAAYAFERGSVNRIVAKCGIAKGSFYQYFEDKQDLFLYLIRLAGEKKLTYISPVMVNPDQHDFFTLIREMYVAGIRFANDHPGYAEISKRMLANKEGPIYRKVMVDNVPTANAFFEGLLESAVVRGEVRADIDIKMTAFMIVSLNQLAMEYHTGQSADVFGENMIEMVDELLAFLKHGIGVRGG